MPQVYSRADGQHRFSGPGMQPVELGRHVLGAGSIVLGATGIYWRDLATPWQPAPPGLPSQHLIALAVAWLLLTGGAAIQFRRAAVIASLSLALVYGVFVIFWLFRLLGEPGFYTNWLGAAEQLAVTIGALAVCDVRWKMDTRRLAEIAFGVCVLIFGGAHFVYLRQTAAHVPAWLLNGLFWAGLTGAADMIAGAALVSGRFARQASILLGMMFAVFELCIWLPRLFESAGAQQMWGGDAHMAWGGFGVTMALTGAAWSLISDRRAASRPALAGRALSTWPALVGHDQREGSSGIE